MCWAESAEYACRSVRLLRCGAGFHGDMQGHAAVPVLHHRHQLSGPCMQIPSRRMAVVTYGAGMQAACMGIWGSLLKPATEMHSGTPRPPGSQGCCAPVS